MLNWLNKFSGINPLIETALMFKNRIQEFLELFKEVWKNNEKKWKQTSHSFFTLPNLFTRFFIHKY